MERKENRFEEALHRAGLKATRARIAILEAFPRDCRPMNAEGLCAEVHAEKIDQATVYRTLKSLEGKGLVRPVDLRRDSAHYELADAHHHHHIVCTGCGEVEAFDACAIEAVSRKALRASSRFKSVTAHSLELFGVCRSCARA